jgi:hypothetical protein
MAERRLLVNCARLEMDAPMASDTEALLHQPLDWDALLLHARLHSVAPLVYRWVNRFQRQMHIPALARQGLLRLWHAAAYRNRLFTREHHRVVEAFDRASVPVIVPKGVVLLEEVYGNLALRPLIDLIFLVPADREAAATQALLRSGYVQKPLPAVDGLYRWCCPQLLFETFRGMRIQALLLSDLVSWPRWHRLNTPPLWQRARIATLAGGRVRLLSPVDQVLYLCLQADNHGYFNAVALETMPAAELLFAEWSNNRLIRFTDIYEVIRRHRLVIDWERLAEHACAGGVEGAVYASLCLAGDLLGDVVPDSALARLRPPRSGGIRRRVWEAVAPQFDPRPPSVLKRAVGRRWRAARPYDQIRLARVIGLIEMVFPGLQAFRDTYQGRSRAPAVALYAERAARALLRSCATVLRFWLSGRFTTQQTSPATPPSR